MIRYILWILLVPISIYTQEIKTPSIKIIEPTIDSVMQVPSHRRCAYYDSFTPMLIINKEYVIYQSCNSRAVFYPDMASFRIPAKDNIVNAFVLDKNAVYFQGSRIKTDTTGFRILGEIYKRDSSDFFWKTKDAVYKNTKKIKVAHVKTFQAAGSPNDGYFKDDFFVYYFDKKIEGSDGITVHTPINNFTFDKNNSYLKGEIITYENEKIVPVNKMFYKTSKHVLTRKGDDFILHKDGNAATLKALSKSYTIDKNNVYYQGVVLPVKSEHLKNVKIWEKTNSAFLSDGENIYYKKEGLQKELDAKTFGMYTNSNDYYFDKNGIYHRKWDEEINNVIQEKISFQYKSAVSKENTFIPKSSRYIIYENQVYDDSKKILYLNLTNEQIQLAKENKLDRQLLPIEKKYFNGVYQTNNKIYWDQKETMADAATFTLIGSNYKDLTHVYMIDETKGFINIEGIDSSTAEDFNGFIMDTNYLYANHKKIIKSTDVELLGVFNGYVSQCSQDNTPTSDFYLFKNIEGYWLVEKVYNKITIRSLGDTLGDDWNTGLPDFKLK